eukprot:356700_1
MMVSVTFIYKGVTSCLTLIYMQWNRFNVKIECDTREDRSTVHRDFVLYCTQQFDENCTLQCPQNDVGIEIVDEPNCFCADYVLPTPQPTHNPTMRPTTSPSFSPTRYDPNQESPNILYVSKKGCDAGPCDSDRFDWSTYEPDCLKQPSTTISSSSCTTDNTLLFNVTGNATITHSVIS